MLMKLFSRLSFSLFTVTTLLFSTGAMAQEKTQQQQNENPSGLGCIDPVVRLQAQNIKDHYTKQGFTIFKDAMVSIESMTQYPVIVGLKQGELYQICYVANPSYQNMHMTLYDGNDVIIDKRDNFKNREEPNYFIMPFTPTSTDEYLITIIQKIKNKTLCGNFFILRADPSKTPETVEPYTDTNKY